MTIRLLHSLLHRACIAAIILLLCLFGSLLGVKPASAQSSVAVPAPVNRDKIHSDLNEILSSPEFNPQTTNNGTLRKAIAEVTKQWDRAKKWLSDIWRRFTSAGGVMTKSGIIQWIFIILFIAVAVVVIYRLIRYAFSQKMTGSGEPLEITFDVVDDELPDPEELLKQAKKLAGEGSYREAIRLLFLASLLKLDQRAWLAYRKDFTNQEYLKGLKINAAAELHTELEEVVSLFEPAVYDNEPVGAEELETFETHCNRLQELAIKTGGPQELTEAAEGAA